MDDAQKLALVFQLLAEERELRKEEERLRKEEERLRKDPEQLLEPKTIYPLQIVPAADFASKQLEIGRLLSTSDVFSSKPLFPNDNQLEYVRSFLRPISSEGSLRRFERDVVENVVWKLVDYAYDDPLLRDRLGLLGSASFDGPHNRLLDSLTQDLGERSDSEPSSDSQSRGSSARHALPKLKGGCSNADSFCMYRNGADGQNMPILAIEYKAPHKLRVDEIVTGLESEIQPSRDVINKPGEGEDFASASKKLAAAAITQLFSYMVGRGIRYGYVCTGEAFVFLHIPDDPAIVHYSVCVPSQDVAADGEQDLDRTAVAQVLAFLLRALRAEPPSMAWYDKAARLDTWDMDYDDILSSIPASVREEEHHTPYKPLSWKRCPGQSPIQTHSRGRKRPRTAFEACDDKDDENNSGGSSSPTSKRGAVPKRDADNTPQRSGQQSDQAEGGGGGGIKMRPYCTQKCLLGLARGTPVDDQCPNAQYHKDKHIGQQEFLDLIRAQLATDLRLSSHGYTLVAKGVDASRIRRLRHEKGLYDRLATLQGKSVPVCLGISDLDLPWYFDGAILEHFMFLGWAGQPIQRCITPDMNKTLIIKELRVLHCDAEPRNILYDAEQRRVMIVDFDRAIFNEIQGRPDGRGEMKRKNTLLKDGHFAHELEHVEDRLLEVCK
ncbi:hypothetical protein ACQKWADRAFT_322919 [Trichoderma austrokoningii]